jgi:hypothetical protein
MYVCMYVCMYTNWPQDLLLYSKCEKGRGNRENQCVALFSVYAAPRVCHPEVLEIRPGTRHVDSLHAVGSYAALRRAAKLVVVGLAVCTFTSVRWSFRKVDLVGCGADVCLAASGTSDQLSFLFCCSLSIWLLSDLENVLTLVVCCRCRCCTREFFLVAYIAACICCGVFKSRTLRRRRAASRICGQRRSDLWRKWDGFGLLFFAPTH